MYRTGNTLSNKRKSTVNAAFTGVFREFDQYFDKSVNQITGFSLFNRRLLAGK